MRRVNRWYDLKGRVVMLTGATGFIGPHYAETLSECGANVMVLDLDQQSCDGLAARLRQQYKTEPLPLVVDISQEDQVTRAVETIVERYGRLDILINNAAFDQLVHVRDGVAAPVEEFPIDVFRTSCDVNLVGTFACCKAVGRQMLRQGGGVILNIASVYGVVAADQRIYGSSGINSNVAYAVTKAGIIMMSRYLASFWQGKGIRVNSLSPGGVFRNQDPEFLENYTKKTMLDRMADLEDVCSAMLYLVSDASKFVTGDNMIVDGGFTAW